MALPINPAPMAPDDQQKRKTINSRQARQLVGVGPRCLHRWMAENLVKYFYDSRGLVRIYADSLFKSSFDFNRKLLSVKQAQLLTGISRRQMYSWLKQGKAKYVVTASGTRRIFADTLFDPTYGEFDYSRPLASIEEVKELLRLSKRTIYKRMREGQVLFVRTVGGRVRIFLDSIPLARSQSMPEPIPREDPPPLIPPLQAPGRRSPRPGPRIPPPLPEDDNDREDDDGEPPPTKH